MATTILRKARLLMLGAAGLLGIFVMHPVVASASASAPVRASGPTCDGLAATIVGTAGADVLHGTSGPDVIVGLRNEAPTGNPAVRALSRQGRRLADRAAWQATELLSRARASIQERLGERSGEDEAWDSDPSWN